MSESTQPRTPRAASLERLSRSHLDHAVQAASAGPTSVTAAYEAGYLALMSALSPAEVETFADHPNQAAAELGAQRLGLGVDDQAKAVEGAAGYYSPEQRSSVELRRTVEWARRTRTAAGWSA